MNSPADPLVLGLIGFAILLCGYLNWRYDLTRRYAKWLSGGRLKAFDGRIARFYYREFTSAGLALFGLALVVGSLTMIGR